MHTILGTSNACVATHPSDRCVAAAALDATVYANGPAGRLARRQELMRKGVTKMRCLFDEAKTPKLKVSRLFRTCVAVLKATPKPRS